MTAAPEAGEPPSKAAELSESLDRKVFLPAGSVKGYASRVSFASQTPTSAGTRSDLSWATPMTPMSASSPRVLTSPRGMVSRSGGSWATAFSGPSPANRTVLPTPRATEGSLGYPAGLGWTPVAGRTPVSVYPKASPVASFSDRTPSASNSMRAYPPGLGFTPLAAATESLGRRSLYREAPLAPATPGGLLKRTASFALPEDGPFPRELLLFYRDPDRSAGLTAGQAGFLLPQPGWISAVRVEEVESSCAARTSGKAKVPARKNEGGSIIKAPIVMKSPHAGRALLVETREQEPKMVAASVAGHRSVNSQWWSAGTENWSQGPQNGWTWAGDGQEVAWSWDGGLVEPQPGNSRAVPQHQHYWQAKTNARNKGAGKGKAKWSC